MANTFIPVRINYSGSAPTGFAEYQTGETMSMPGNLQLSGSGRRIYLEGSSATLSDRAFIQNPNSAQSVLGIMPGATSSTSGVHMYTNPSDLNNSSRFDLLTDGAACYVAATRTGTGAYLPLTFSTGGSERYRIDTGGSHLFGANTNNPISNKVNAMRYVPGGGLFIYEASTAVFSIGANNAQLVNFWFNGLTGVGSITTNGTSTAYNTSSDYRLKDQIENADADAAWARLDGYRIRSFVYKTQPDKRVEYGGVAHELAETNPDMVTGAKDAVQEFGTLYAMRPVGDLYDIGGELIASRIEEPFDHGGWWEFTGMVEAVQAEDYLLPVNPLPGTRWEKTGERMVIQGVDWSKPMPEMILNQQTAKSKIIALEQRAAAQDERITQLQDQLQELLDRLPA